MAGRATAGMILAQSDAGQKRVFSRATRRPRSAAAGLAFASVWIGGAFAARYGDIAPSGWFEEIAHTAALWASVLIVAFATGVLVARWRAVVVTASPIAVGVAVALWGERDGARHMFEGAVDWTLLSAAAAALGVAIGRTLGRLREAWR